MTKAKVMMMRNKLIYIGVIVSCVIGGFAFWQGDARQQKSEPQTGFVITYKWTRISPQGEEKALGTIVRMMDKKGNWREIKKHADGGKEEIWVDIERGGVFRVSHTLQKVFKIMETGPRTFPTGEELQKSPQFVGTEQMFGYTAYHFIGRRDDGNIHADFYTVPELGNFAIKETNISEDGTRTVVTATLINRIEPNAAAVRLPNYKEERPVKK
ncbi:MAG TPA: hypothetical protein VF791_06590 [Pyrinomonadaceae bacterium]